MTALTAYPWTALALFAFVSSITPGPNNLLATSSGARFGLRRTLPQVAGVTAGFTVLLCGSATGVAALLAEHPLVGNALAVCGYVYLLWLSATLLLAAWRPQRATTAGIAALRPQSFVQAALFQFANPKAWMMAISGASIFLDGHGSTLAAIFALCGLFAVVNFPCVGAWAWMGARLQRWLQDPQSPWRLRGFNAAMGTTMLATTVWMVAMA